MPHARFLLMTNLNKVSASLFSKFSSGMPLKWHRLIWSGQMQYSLDSLKHLEPDSYSSQQLISDPLVEQWRVETKEFSAKEPLRVLIVLSQQPSETGSGVYLREVVSELQKRGHKPY